MPTGRQTMRLPLVLAGAWLLGAAPLQGAPAHGPGPLTWYVVPAMSPVKRLPDAFPWDGEPGAPLRIVAAKDEFEPASWVLFAFTNIAGAEITASGLTGRAGTLPASCLDVRVVKCWYQAGTAWYSYFADATGRSLVPELLLHDETLIRTDPATRDNYLRVDYPGASQYVWISAPPSVDVPFNAETEPVADAPALQPVSLAAGEFKQFWVTAHIPRDAAPGVYTGCLAIACGGAEAAAIPVRLRVLPFELPDPKTYYDIGKDFYTMLYNEPGYGDILKANGGDAAHADRKMLALYRNMRDHNVRHPLIRAFRADSEAAFIRQLELFKKAGLCTTTVFGAIPGFPGYDWLSSPAVKNAPLRDQPAPDDYLAQVDRAAAIVRRVFGRATVYAFGWDEPGTATLVAERKPWQGLHDRGWKVYSTGHDRHLAVAGYNEDFCNSPGVPARSKSEKWHAMGQRIANYASPHTGPENPDFMRRIHGLQLYKANYDSLGNYILTCVRWNDFLGSYNYRGFNMTYPAREGVLDTLAWEGTREGIDDIRYATRLKQLAARAIATGKTENVYAGRKALQWLELLDETSADLNTARLEMIRYLDTLEGMR